MRRRVGQDPEQSAGGRKLRLVLTCEVCGRPIELTPGPAGVVLANREAFLQEHAACLEATGLNDEDA